MVQPLAVTGGKVTNIGSCETLCPPPQTLVVSTPPSATIFNEVKCFLTYLPIPGNFQQLFVFHDCTIREEKAKFDGREQKLNYFHSFNSNAGQNNINNLITKNLCRNQMQSDFANPLWHYPCAHVFERSSEQ